MGCCPSLLSSNFQRKTRTIHIYLRLTHRKNTDLEHNTWVLEKNGEGGDSCWRRASNTTKTRRGGGTGTERRGGVSHTTLSVNRKESTDTVKWREGTDGKFKMTGSLKGLKNRASVITNLDEIVFLVFFSSPSEETSACVLSLIKSKSTTQKEYQL